jgi:hypothetical protein
MDPLLIRRYAFQTSCAIPLGFCTKLCQSLPYPSVLNYHLCHCAILSIIRVRLRTLAHSLHHLGIRNEGEIVINRPGRLDLLRHAQPTSATSQLTTYDPREGAFIATDPLLFRRYAPEIRHSFSSNSSDTSITAIPDETSLAASHSFPV